MDNYSNLLNKVHGKTGFMLKASEELLFYASSIGSTPKGGDMVKGEAVTKEESNCSIHLAHGATRNRVAFLQPTDGVVLRFLVRGNSLKQFGKHF